MLDCLVGMSRLWHRLTKGYLLTIVMRYPMANIQHYEAIKSYLIEFSFVVRQKLISKNEIGINRLYGDTCAFTGCDSVECDRQTFPHTIL